jgi:hypothetical protein
MATSHEIFALTATSPNVFVRIRRHHETTRITV